jgi:DNA-binding NtrC family response regulator
MTPTRILVHADRAIGELLDDILRLAGYHVTVRPPMSSTFDLADSPRPDVIILHSLDDCTRASLALIERFGSSTFPSNTALLVVSSHLSPNTIVQRFDGPVPIILLGMPFDIDRLLSSVEQLVVTGSPSAVSGEVMDCEHPGDDIVFS